MRSGRLFCAVLLSPTVAISCCPHGMPLCDGQYGLAKRRFAFRQSSTTNWVVKWGAGGLHTPSPARCPSPSRCRGPYRSHGANVLTVRTATHAVCFAMAQGGKPCAKLQLFRQRFLSGPRPRSARYAQVATLHQNRIPTARP